MSIAGRHFFTMSWLSIFHFYNVPFVNLSCSFGGTFLLFTCFYSHPLRTHFFVGSGIILQSFSFLHSLIVQFVAGFLKSQYEFFSTAFLWNDSFCIIHQYIYNLLIHIKNCVCAFPYMQFVMFTCHKLPTSRVFVVSLRAG